MNMRLRIAASITTLILFALTLVAAQPDKGSKEKKLWEWTDDERIAIRLDQAARKARVEKVMRVRRDQGIGRLQTNSSLNALPSPIDTIYGTDHPELFMRTEILSALTHAAFATEDDVARHTREELARKAIAFGLPKDFLVTLEFESREFISLQRHEYEVGEKLARGDSTAFAEIRRTRDAECPVLAESVRRLRRVFGVAFDRFLYEVFAPTMFREFDEFDSVETATDLKRREAGCQ
jgi:hypothetical protein